MEFCPECQKKFDDNDGMLLVKEMCTNCMNKSLDYILEDLEEEEENNYDE